MTHASAVAYSSVAGWFCSLKLSPHLRSNVFQETGLWVGERADKGYSVADLLPPPLKPLSLVTDTDDGRFHNSPSEEEARALFFVFGTTPPSAVTFEETA